MNFSRRGRVRILVCWLTLTGSVSVIPVKAQSTVSELQILQPAPLTSQPEDFGLHLSVDGSTLVASEKDGVHVYSWDSALEIWASNSSYLDLEGIVDGVAAHLGRIAYVVGTEVTVIGPVSHSISLTHLPDSIALNGDLLAVGYTAGNAVDVYVVPFDASSPSLLTTLSTNEAGWDYGHALDFSDDGQFLAVGAPNSSDTVTGRTYVYQSSSALPTVRIPVLPFGLWFTYEHVEADNGFGDSVALNEDGTLLVVGAPFEDTTLGVVNVGGVFIYDNLSTDLLAVFGGNAMNHRLGTSVDVSGRTVLGGEPNFVKVAPGRGTVLTPGRLVVYEEKPNWKRVAFLEAGVGEQDQGLGETVALTKYGILGAAPFRSYDGSNADRGAIFHFRLSIFSDDFESGGTSAWTP